MNEQTVPIETAYYYPEPYWRQTDGSWILTLLLFFDKISILLPSYMHGQHYVADPGLTAALEDRDFLLVLQPETFLDRAMAEGVRSAVLSLLELGAFDELDRDKPYMFDALSQSRLGWNSDIDLAQDLISTLKAEGLALDSEDGLSVPLHRDLRTTVLVILSQLAQARGFEMGLALRPITPDRARVEDLIKTLRLGTTDPTKADVVSLDLETVGLNLEGVTLEELLEFKAEHGHQYRDYARSVRQAVAEISSTPEVERSRLLADRRDELAQDAERLRTAARKRWRVPLARFSLGAAGTTLAVASGNLPGALVTALGGVLGSRPGPKPESAYSYLFEAGRRLGR